MEIGIDIEKNERFVNISESVIKRAFTKDEIAYAESKKNKHQVYCSFWCTKEATIKAFSNRTIPFQEINISANADGKPFVVKNKTILNELEKLGLSDIKISISHAKDYSTAVCMIY